MTLDLLGIPLLLVTLTNLILVTAGQPINFPLFIIGQIMGWPAAICFLCLLFNKVRNKSVGAGDNATGIAIVMELARYFKAQGGLDNYETIFASFAAEEVGLVGSGLWLKQYGGDMNPANSFIFNFDMIGKPGLQYMSHIGLVKKPTNRKLNPLVAHIAKHLDIEMGSFWVPIGAMTDRDPFAKRGWEGIDFITRALGMQAHTPRDTMENIDGDILVQACEIARIGAETLDKGEL